MERRVNRTVKSLLLITVISLLIVVLSFSGCKAGATAETTAAETTAAQETMQPEETSAETTGAETTAAEVLDEITGNINMLTGMELSDEVSGNRPMAVMVENTPDARPQSGLVHADVVVEVEDEYGITRFVTVFSSYDGDLIVGPVRSARPYYAEIAASFDPYYVFWGTHPSFYIIVQNLGLDYLSPLGDTSGASSITGNFSDPGSGEGKDAIRDSSRVAPHNAYVRIPRMREIAQAVGYSLEGGQSPFHFKEDAIEADRGNIESIGIDFSSASYKVEFQYDSASNTYFRFVAGVPNTDRETGEQIEVNNVVVMLTDIRNSGDAEGHMIVRTTQGGDAYYFIDGKAIEGTWSRTSALEPFVFKDLDGNTILFNRGQTWMAMTRGVGNLEY